LSDTSDYTFLTEGQLKFRKFLKHKVAVFSAFVLFILYTIVIFADFFAPYGMLTNHKYHLYEPPQISKIRFVDNEGNFSWRPFSYRQIAKRDPKTLRFIYVDDTEQKDFIHLFVQGEKYKMFGLVESNIHFFGVKEGKLFLFGTDIIGRDLLSRIIFGGRVSLSIGLIGVFILVILGTIIGTISGYFGGWYDNVIQRIIEIVRTIPQVALWMALASIIPKEWPSSYVYLGIVIIFGFISWAGLARELRGKVLAIRRSDFIYAAEISGASASRIIRTHIIPNVLSHIIVIATLSIPIMIIGEAALSFLGLGIKPPMTSWGLLLTKLKEVQTLKHYPWLITPAGFIVISVLCFNFIGDAIRDLNDPHSK
jgi:peptide/nickel transport system permease protein